jgi:hypothetical protein
MDERKSTSGGAFFLGDSLVAWLSKKQGSIFLSTTEVEYIAAATCCTQVLWMIQTLAYLEVFSLKLMSKGEKKVLSVCYSWRSKQNSAAFQDCHQCQRGRLLACLQEECACH